MAKKKTDYTVILGIAGVGALIYFLSKQKTGDNGGFQLPGLPSIGINVPTEFQIPAFQLPELDGFTCPGLTMPDLSHLLRDLNLGLPDLGIPDLGIPDLGLPDVGGLLGDGERKTWNPLWFLPDIKFDLPKVSISGLPSLPSLPDLFIKLLFTPLGPWFPLPLIGQSLYTWFKGGGESSVTEDTSECPGGVCPTSSRSLTTPFFIPGPVGAESAPVAKVAVPVVSSVSVGAGGPPDLYIL